MQGIIFIIGINQDIEKLCRQYDTILSTPVKNKNNILLSIILRFMFFISKKHETDDITHQLTPLS